MNFLFQIFVELFYTLLIADKLGHVHGHALQTTQLTRFVIDHGYHQRQHLARHLIKLGMHGEGKATTGTPKIIKPALNHFTIKRTYMAKKLIKGQ